MSRFNLASDEDILSGGTTDTYFKRTEDVLKRLGKDDQRVLAEFTASSLPLDWDYGVFCGMDEVLTLMEDREVNVHALPEGTIFHPRTHSGVRLPVLTIEGPYGRFGVFETPILGLICQASGIATKASRVRRAAGTKQVLSFGIRRMHPAISPMIDRAAYVGGCDDVSSLSGAERLGKEPRGTMPHALIIILGDPQEAFAAFDEHVDKAVQRIALVDTYNDEVRESIAAAETVEDLAGVRLDTPGSRKGDFEDLVREVRWELDIRGHEDVQVFVSGGLDEDTIPGLITAGADGFGVGTSISNAPTINFAMDIVEMDGRPVAKRGKFGGRKEVLKCPEDLTYEVASRAEVCPVCGGPMVQAMVEYVRRGRIAEAVPPEDEVRSYVLEQLERLSSLG